MSDALTCREFIDFLDDYVEGCQPSAVVRTFESHLHGCAACRDYLRTYRETISLSKACHEDPPPGDVPEQLIEAILAARRQLGSSGS